MFSRYGRVLICWLIAFPLFAAENLTPTHEPYGSSFYVCYEYTKQRYIIKSLMPYAQLRYLGCRITRTPCCQIKTKFCPGVQISKRCRLGRVVQVKSCPTCHLKSFGWYNTYLQALNGFYRCAYNG